MNGEVFQISKIVLTTRLALQGNIDFSFSLSQYENKIVFRFLNKKTILGNREVIEYTPEKWYKRITANELKYIYLLINTGVKHGYLRGFANTWPICMETFYKNGHVTYWTPMWEFDSKQKMWNIEYTEHEWSNPPKGLPGFDDPSDDYGNVLCQIEKLANVIGCEGFGKIFHDAYEILVGEENVEIPEWMEDVETILSGKNLRLFLAASKADVFGGMGSWNDDPSGMAHEKGMLEEYERLSAELLVQNERAIMYAVNVTNCKP